MKSFKQFLNEADIKGNPAVTPEYLASLNQRAEQSAREIEQKYGREMGSLMRLVHSVQSIQRGKERELAALSQSVILNQYGAILGETELDVRIPTDPREMKQQMDKSKPEKMELPSIEELENEDTQRAVHKRKILNMIAQGEAINSKKMLMSEENMAGLVELFGEEAAKSMVDSLIKITDICNARDWRIPEEVGAQMIQNGNGLSGVSKIEWKPEESGEDENEDDETGEGETQEEGSTPKLIILGLDQAMLFHEAVKAIYGLINQGGLAHLSEDDIMTVFMNTDTPEDEVQDLKRAKLTAADLRDFIHSFHEVHTIENGREYVWGKMIDATNVDDAKFLELMKQIFESAPLYRELGPNEAPYTETEIAKANESFPKAKATVQKLINEIIDELAEWKESMQRWEEGDYEDQYTSLGIEQPAERGEEDLSQEEIQDLIDQALDKRDFTEAERLSALLKESREDDVQRLRGLGMAPDKLGTTLAEFKKMLKAEYQEYIDSIRHEDDWMSIWDFYSENAKGYEREYGITRNEDGDLEYHWSNANYSEEDDDEDYDY